jgi:hypothetical protein
MPARNLRGDVARLASSDPPGRIRSSQCSEVGCSSGPGRHGCRLCQQGDQDRSHDDNQAQGEGQDRP